MLRTFLICVPFIRQGMFLPQLYTHGQGQVRVSGRLTRQNTRVPQVPILGPGNPRTPWRASAACLTVGVCRKLPSIGAQSQLEVREGMRSNCGRAPKEVERVRESSASASSPYRKGPPPPPPPPFIYFQNLADHYLFHTCKAINLHLTSLISITFTRFPRIALSSQGGSIIFFRPSEPAAAEP
jgi:hypothetical protein